MNAFEDLARGTIATRAEREHAEKCLTRGCSVSGHIANDYLPRIRREVAAEMREALAALTEKANAQ